MRLRFMEVVLVVYHLLKIYYMPIAQLILLSNIIHELTHMLIFKAVTTVFLYIL